jgi:biopolymer transport protein ExbD
LGVRSRNKVTAEFNMSSLTDIIFLLLIFFMLTSSMVQINMPLPKSVSKTVAPTDLAVMIRKNGEVSVNGKVVPMSQLDKKIASSVRGSGTTDNATVSIISESGVTYDKIHAVMKIAASLRLKAILATDQPKG